MAEISHRKQTGHIVLFVSPLTLGALVLVFLWAVATGFGDGGDSDHSVPPPTIYVPA